MNAKTPMEAMLDSVSFIPTNLEKPESDLPYVTHTGVLKIGNISIEVLVLSNGQRVITEEEMNKFFNGISEDEL
jgi:hypothetical protein